MAKQIIYALSVHRLTTNGLDVQFGLTAENLKDDLCLYLPMPEQDADFLLGAVNATLKEIMKTVSGQFIIHNESNNQYYIDVDKVVDYDERIKQKASMMAGERTEPLLLYRGLRMPGMGCEGVCKWLQIYQYDLNWILTISSVKLSVHGAAGREKHSSAGKRFLYPHHAAVRRCEC